MVQNRYYKERKKKQRIFNYENSAAILLFLAKKLA
jgi:hypothetical protein